MSPHLLRQTRNGEPVYSIDWYDGSLPEQIARDIREGRAKRVPITDAEAEAILKVGLSSLTPKPVTEAGHR